MKFSPQKSLMGLAAGFAAMLVSGCVSQTPLPQYSDSVRVASIYAYDDSSQLVTHPLSDEITGRLNEALTNRNLSASQVQYDTYSQTFGEIRDTDRRIQLFKKMANSSDILVLVELKADYYSVLSGRYRWNVNVHVTVYDPLDNSRISDEFTLPAALLYQHQTGEDAIDSVKDEIYRKIGGIVDQFMKGRGVSGGSASQPVVTQLENGHYTVALCAQKVKVQDPEPVETVVAPAAADTSDAIYFVMVDRFFDLAADTAPVDKSDPGAWHGGDLKGITAKLPYLKEMGIKTLWLSPIFESGQQKFFGNGAFHGYWTYDLRRIEQRFGSQADFEELTREAKKYGIKILLDLVVNHVGYGAPLIEQKPDWFHPALTIEDWNDPKQLTEREVHGLPDLNQDNPEVYDYLLKATLQWLKMDNVAGFRLDAVKHVSLAFWKKFNAELKQNSKDIMLLGEYFDGAQNKVNDVQREGEFTHLFDFPLAFALRDVYCEHRSLGAIASVISNDDLYTDPNTLVTFIDNHDMPRFISHCNGDQARMGNALSVLLSVRGIPSFFYGTEVPLAGREEPFNRPDMSFDQPVFYQLIQSKLSDRSKYSVFHHGKSTILEYEPNLMVIGEEKGSEQALVCIATDLGASKTVHLPEGQWQKLGDQGGVFENQFEISPNSVVTFVRNNAKDSIIPTGKRTFTFALQDVSEGTYVIAGSRPELGFWNPSMAPRLDAQNGYKVTLTLPQNAVVSYKLVKIMDDGSVQWEDGDNREFFSKTTEESTVMITRR